MINRNIHVARHFVLLALVISTSAAGAAEAWPQFRGPDGQGHATASDLPVEWSETQNIAWKTEIAGRGWSSPVIENDQIWLTTAEEEGHSLRAVCIDRQLGKMVKNIEVFRVASPPAINAKNSYASPTGVLENGRFYVHFGTLGTACLDAATGRVLWTNDTLKLDHKEGPGSSPIVWNDLLIVNCDGIDVQYVVALDKQDGRIVWKSQRPGPLADNTDFRKAYSTPLVIRHGEQDELITTSADQVMGYDPRTGREHWRLRYKGYSNVPRPVFGNDMLYICTGYNHPQLWAIKIGSGPVTESSVAWRATKQVPANPSPLLVGQRIYLVSDQGIASCVDAQTGKEAWKERLSGNYSASPLFADGRLFFFSEEGRTAVVKPGDAFELLATNELSGRIMASAAAVEHALYLRTDTHLYRIEKSDRRTAGSGAR